MSLVQTRSPGSNTAIILAGGPDYNLGANYIDDPPVDCTYIFANRCIFSSSTVKTREIHIHASVVSVPGENFLLTSSGVKGVQNTTAEDQHADGTSAFNILLSSATFQVLNPLLIEANGGDGATGFSPPDSHAQAGAGGKAGNGGNVTFMINTTYDVVADAGDAIIAAPNSAQKTADMKTWAKLAQSVSQPNKPDGISWVFKMQLDPTQPDMDPDGPLPHNINANTWLALMANTIAIMRQDSADYIWDVQCNPGKPGQGGQVPESTSRGPMGKAGTAGKYTRSRLQPADARDSTECLFHPDQVAMTIGDIENSYYIGTTDSIADARNKLQALTNRLAFLDALVPTDNLYQVYVEKEYSILGVLPSSTSKVPTSIASLKNSFSQAKGYLSQINQGLDYYRRAKNWVPRGSYKLYEQALDQLLLDFDAIEQNYNDYQHLKDDNKKRSEQLEQGRLAAVDGENLADATMQTISQEMIETADLIAILQDEIPIKHKAVMDDLDKLADDIQNSFQGPSMSDFLNAASMIAFCPEPGMVAVQGLTLLNGSASTVKDNMGNAVNKDYVVEQIQGLKSGLDGLNEALSIMENDPTLGVDDPGATKLLGQEQDIMDLVNNYRGVLGSDLDEFKALFDDYVNSVLQRNTQVMHYNSLITVFLENRDKRDSCQATQGSLGVEEAWEMNSEIPALAAAIKASYLNYTSNVLELLYDTQRALMFWSLDPYPAGNLASLRQQGFPTNGLGESLKAIKGEIIKNFVDATNALSIGRQPFGIVAGNSNGEAKRVDLNSYQISTLKMAPTRAGGDYAVSIPIPVAFKATSLDTNIFAGNADIRVSKVRCYLEGAKTTDGNLTVSLKHLGDESIVSVHDEEMKFSHDYIPFVFEYNLNTGAVLRDGDIGTDEDTYALPGPFAQWRIAVSTSGNRKPDLSKVTKVWLEFSGYSRSFR